MQGVSLAVRCFAANSVNDVETLISSDFPAIEASKQSIELPKTSYISKNFEPTLKPWFVPYPTSRRRTRLTQLSDARNKLDVRFSKAFKELYRQHDQHINQYVARKLSHCLSAWFTMFPSTAIGQKV